MIQLRSLDWGGLPIMKGGGLASLPVSFTDFAEKESRPKSSVKRSTGINCGVSSWTWATSRSWAGTGLVAQISPAGQGQAVPQHDIAAGEVPTGQETALEGMAISDTNISAWRK